MRLQELPCGPALLQLRHGSVGQQHRLVVSALSLLGWKEWHSHHQNLWACFSLQHFDCTRQQPAKRLCYRPHLLVFQQMDHLAQFVLIDRIGYRSFERRRGHSAGRAQKPLGGKLPGIPYPFHIKGLSTEAAAGHRLWRHSIHTSLANGSHPKPQEGQSARSAISWIKSRYNIIQHGPNHPSRPLHPLWHHKPVHHPTRRRSGWSPGSSSERIVIQAIAEDAPQSSALQATLAAPFIAV